MRVCAALDAASQLILLIAYGFRLLLHRKKRSGSKSASSVQATGLEQLEANRSPQQPSSMTLHHRRPFVADAAPDCAPCTADGFGGLQTLAGTER